jgi:hypothetical protein
MNVSDHRRVIEVTCSGAGQILDVELGGCARYFWSRRRLGTASGPGIVLRAGAASAISGTYRILITQRWIRCGATPGQLPCAGFGGTPCRVCRFYTGTLRTNQAELASAEFRARTTPGQLGDDRISDQVSHQFNLKTVQGDESGIESLACGIE